MAETIVLVREVPYPESATRDATAVWREMEEAGRAKYGASPETHAAQVEAAEDFFDRSITYTVRLVPRGGGGAMCAGNLTPPPPVRTLLCN